LRPIAGKIELIPELNKVINTLSSAASSKNKERQVIIIGSGPAGLFAALALVSQNIRPVIIERGKAVEDRGKDIGKLFNRKILSSESNLCYGEGGAGTWSDGKLTTQIGKNSDDVRRVLRSLVDFGAPEKILVDGKPHLVGQTEVFVY